MHINRMLITVFFERYDMLATRAVVVKHVELRPGLSFWYGSSDERVFPDSVGTSEGAFGDGMPLAPVSLKEHGNNAVILVQDACLI